MKKKLLCLLYVLTFFGNVALLSACTQAVAIAPDDNNHKLHNLVHHQPIAATCTKAGNVEYWSCAECGKYFSDENAVNEIESVIIPATGHSWSEWEVSYPASCTLSGSEKRTCLKCIQYETRTIPASHDFSGGWKFDTHNHWLECKNCAEKQDIGAHSISGDSCTVCGYKITYTENLEYELSGDGSYYIVTDCGKADDTFIFIPPQFGGIPVKGVGDSAFKFHATLTGIYFPESIEFISVNAFYGCRKLKSVKMQNGINTIGVNAFKDCKALQDIEISSSLTFIGQDAFKNCNALRSVYIRDITAWCQIQFENSEANPLRNNLYLNGELVTDLVIPGAISTIEDYTFLNYKGLASIEIGFGVTEIGECAFYGCTSLTSVTLPETLATIGKGAFYHCTSLNNLIIPDYVMTIGEYAFYDCSSLTYVAIPGNGTTVDQYAFQFCSALTRVDIQNGVTRIGNRAFEGCTALTEAYFADPFNWRWFLAESIPSEQLSDPQTAAELLKSGDRMEKI